MARELKIHLFRPDEAGHAMCGKHTESGSFDHEETTCKSCSGMYRTNVEWYSQIRNKVVESKSDTGSGDIYTRQDVEAGLARLGMGHTAIQVILNKTSLFRNVFLEEERSVADPWTVIQKSDGSYGAARLSETR